MTKRPTKARKPGKTGLQTGLTGKPEAKASARSAAKSKSARAVAAPSKAGHSRLAGAARCEAFAAAYLTNGHNATAAAIAAGCPPASAKNAGWKLLQKPEVKALLAVRAEKIAERAGMNAATWADQLQAVSCSSIGDHFDAAGELIPVPLLPRHVQAAISGIVFDQFGKAIAYKFWDKPGALAIMARHLGLYERDNAQQTDIRVRVELVG